jgi:hypothetical protein
MSFSKVRIADTIAEDATAISPFALVERLCSFRCRFLKHDSSHRAMVQIAQRSEVHLWMRLHGFSLQGIPSGQSQWSGKARMNLPETGPKSTILAALAHLFCRAEGPREI